MKDALMSSSSANDMEATGNLSIQLPIKFNSPKK